MLKRVLFLILVGLFLLGINPALSSNGGRPSRPGAQPRLEKISPSASSPTEERGMPAVGISCTLRINEISPSAIYTNTSRVTVSYNLSLSSPLDISTIPVKVGLFLDNQLKETSEINNFPNRETRRLFISLPAPNQAKEYLLTLKAVRGDVSVERASREEIYATASQRIRVMAETERPCEVRGTIVNVPDYIKLEIFVYAAEGRINVPGGTRRLDFNFNVEPEKDFYKLNYVYKREYGRESAPKFTPEYTYYLSAFVVPVPALSRENRVFTDATRDFAHLTSGIFLKDRQMRTDRTNYTFGDVISLAFQVYVKGPAGTAEKEKGAYVVTVSSSGLELEAGRGEIEVSPGEEKNFTVPIHHAFYSRGRNIIKLKIQTPGYNFEHSTTCNIE